MTLDYSFTWDWKEQPNWNKIADAIGELNENTRDKIRFYDIETRSDEYGLVISVNDYDETEAYQVWERGLYGDSEDSNCTIHDVSFSEAEACICKVPKTATLIDGAWKCNRCGKPD